MPTRHVTVMRRIAAAILLGRNATLRKQLEINMAEVPAYIEEIMEAVYPGAGALALASFNEEKALRDATAAITELQNSLVEANPILRSCFQVVPDRRGIEPDDGKYVIGFLVKL